MVIQEKINCENINRYFPRSNWDNVDLNDLVNLKRTHKFLQIDKLNLIVRICNENKLIMYVDFAEGKGIKQANKQLDNLCENNNIKVIRCYTIFKGMTKILKNLGYRYIKSDGIEKLYEKEL